MNTLAILLAVTLTPFPLTPFAQLGQQVDSLKLVDTSFTVRAENNLFVAGDLQTQGGTFLVFLRTDGTADQSIRAIEFVSDDTSTLYGVRAQGSCDWLKKKLGLLYGTPVNAEEGGGPDSTFKKVTWQDSKHSVVVSYHEQVTTSFPRAVACGLTAQIID